MMKPESGLTVTNLQVRHLEKTILAIEAAFFRQGRIHAIVGPSGAGKSTFLRILNLLEAPQSGTVDYFGSTISLPGLSQVQGLPIQRSMAFVAQKPAMFQSSVYENVALGLRYRRMDRRVIRERVESALQMVELAHAAQQRADTLSGGEAQRIALARALVLKPTLLLLDEPTANLDPYHVSIFERVIQSVHRTEGTTILIVTHNLPQAKRLADSCWFMHKGCFVEEADTERFFQAPASQELGDFLSGRMIC